MNLLPITDTTSPYNPQDYHCHIQTYAIGHSELIVQVQHITKPHIFYLHFGFVEYFTGTIRWKGADLRILSEETCLSILKKSDRFRDFDELQIMQFSPYKLYEFAGTPLPVQILAAGMAVIDHLE